MSTCLHRRPAKVKGAAGSWSIAFSMTARIARGVGSGGVGGVSSASTSASAAEEAALSPLGGLAAGVSEIPTVGSPGSVSALASCNAHCPLTFTKSSNSASSSTAQGEPEGCTSTRGNAVNGSTSNSDFVLPLLSTGIPSMNKAIHSAHSSSSTSDLSVNCSCSIAAMAIFDKRSKITSLSCAILCECLANRPRSTALYLTCSLSCFSQIVSSISCSKS
mmetsp:Transcript_44952/g.103965  ORF Transcript_44952/g.103965 Transcript_44952/m.103965 type:complete len:219 (+) Transcript_44952:2834-3490(+)